jgi:predicted GIY-YIG superfamily endonuclease/N-acetylglutamate synthase-like GNAT family acetyltransferase
MRKTWYVYVAELGDGTLYTGVTTALAERLARHAAGTGAKYTRGRGGATLRYWEAYPTKGAALSREAAIKRWPRSRKLECLDDATVRPATRRDLPLIAKTIRRFTLDPERLEPEQFVVAMEGKSRAGFARIKPYRGCFELGSVAVLEKFRNRGVASRLVRCLMSKFPTRKVWITTMSPDFFKRFGFEPATPPAELARKLKTICHAEKWGVVAMVAPKPALSPKL